MTQIYLHLYYLTFPQFLPPKLYSSTSFSAHLYFNYCTIITYKRHTYKSNIVFNIFHLKTIDNYGLKFVMCPKNLPDKELSETWYFFLCQQYFSWATWKHEVYRINGVYMVQIFWIPFVLTTSLCFLSPKPFHLSFFGPGFSSAANDPAVQKGKESIPHVIVCVCEMNKILLERIQISFF